VLGDQLLGVLQVPPLTPTQLYAVCPQAAPPTSSKTMAKTRLNRMGRRRRGVNMKA
jgi:hypothetical protein